jgi:hypothetical protein
MFSRRNEIPVEYAIEPDSLLNASFFLALYQIIPASTAHIEGQKCAAS